MKKKTTTATNAINTAKNVNFEADFVPDAPSMNREIIFKV